MEENNLAIGPVQTYPDIFESATFSPSVCVLGFLFPMVYSVYRLASQVYSVKLSGVFNWTEGS